MLGIDSVTEPKFLANIVFYHFPFSFNEAKNNDFFHLSR